MWRIALIDIFFLLMIVAAFYLLYKGLVKSKPIKKLAGEGDVLEEAERIAAEARQRKAVNDAAKASLEEENEKLEELFPENRKQG